MRQAVVLVVALGLFVMLSGVAFAGAGEGFCAFSSYAAKQVAKQQVDTEKKVATKPAAKTAVDTLLLVQTEKLKTSVSAEKK